jgi:uncharacterized protein (TIGR02246 family)
MTDEQQIRALVQGWIDATRAGNVDGVLPLMTDDVVFLMAGQPPMVGRDAFAEHMRAAVGENTVEPTSQIDEITVAGDFAYARSALSVTIVSKHGKLPLQRTGHTLTIFRKEADGKWRLARDANMLGPAA